MITGNKTYDQLYWDKEFVEKRIKEILNHKLDVMERYADGLIPLERAKELNDSINPTLDRFQRQLENIKKLK